MTTQVILCISNIPNPTHNRSISHNIYPCYPVIVYIAQYSGNVLGLFTGGGELFIFCARLCPALPSHLYSVPGPYLSPFTCLYSQSLLYIQFLYVNTLVAILPTILSHLYSGPGPYLLPFTCLFSQSFHLFFVDFFPLYNIDVFIYLKRGSFDINTKRKSCKISNKKKCDLRHYYVILLLDSYVIHD